MKSKNTINSSISRNLFLATVTLAAPYHLLYAEDLGLITVESSTIDINNESLTETSSVSTIDSETIDLIDPKHLNEVLQAIPGITSDVRGGEVVEIHMRGVAQQEFMNEDTGVAIVIDGVPVRQNGGKIRINLSDIETIKVIKGSASYLYGNSALAGAVVITTTKPKNRQQYSLSSEAGSYGYIDTKAKINVANDSHAYNINTNYRYTDGFWEESQLENRSINGKYQYYIDDSSDITLAADITNKYEESIRGTVTGLTAAEQNPAGISDTDISYTKDSNVDLDKFFITYSKDINNHSNLLISTYHYNDIFKNKSTPYDSNADSIEDSYGTQNNENLVQQGIKSEYRINNKSSAYLFGMDVGQANFSDRSDTTADFSATVRGKTSNYYNGEYSDLNSDESKYALYTELKNTLTEKLTSTINLRYDTQQFDYSIENNDYDGSAWSISNTERSSLFNNNSYRAGLSYSLNNKNHLFTNISTGFRLPTVEQLYYGDFDPKKTNNPNLKPTKTYNYEIGIRGKQTLFGNRTSFMASLFQIDTNDIISRELGTYYRNSLSYQNVGNAKSQGLELSSSSDRSKTASYQLSYTYLESEYTKHDPFTVGADSDGDGNDDIYDIVGNSLPRTPNHTLSLFINYKASSKLKLITEIYAKSDFFADETNLVKIQGHAFMNLQARYNIPAQRNKLEVFAKINNVFDNQYYRTAYLHSDRDGDEVLTGEDVSIFVDPGRVYYLGAKYTFK